MGFPVTGSNRPCPATRRCRTGMPPCHWYRTTGRSIETSFLSVVPGRGVSSRPHVGIGLWNRQVERDPVPLENEYSRRPSEHLWRWVEAGQLRGHSPAAVTRSGSAGPPSALSPSPCTRARPRLRGNAEDAPAPEREDADQLGTHQEGPPQADVNAARPGHIRRHCRLRLPGRTRQEPPRRRRRSARPRPARSSRSTLAAVDQLDAFRCDTRRGSQPSALASRQFDLAPNAKIVPTVTATAPAPAATAAYLAGGVGGDFRSPGRRWLFDHRGWRRRRRRRVDVDGRDHGANGSIGRRRVAPAFARSQGIFQSTRSGRPRWYACRDRQEPNVEARWRRQSAVEPPQSVGLLAGSEHHAL